MIIMQYECNINLFWFEESKLVALISIEHNDFAQAFAHK